jgi:hypothetical protein
MPAGLPGSTPVQNAANPSLGTDVSLSPFSGPKGSPFDAKKYPDNVAHPIPSQRIADPTNISTGALNTGIGMEANTKVPGIPTLYNASVPSSAGAFSDDYIPGQTLPGGTLATGAILTCIGGGKSVITAGPGTDYSNGTSAPSPYASQPILNAGNGGSRDAGAGPAFTGFSMKVVTNPTGAVIANGAVIETGWVNRMGVSLLGSQSAFGSSVAASPAVT